MIRVIPTLATLAILGIAVILAWDASTFLLQRADPARGHLVKGCYTLLDDLFRSPSPNGMLRVIELLSPCVLIPAALALRRVGRFRSED